MKKNFLVILLALAFPTFSVAQRRDAIPEIEEQLKQAVAKYDFDTAEELLETRILALTKKKLPTDNEEAQLEQVRQMQLKVETTQQVVFIDSVVVPRAQLLPNLPISAESGSIFSTAQYFNRQDDVDATVFRSQLENQIIFAQQDNDGIIRLYQSNLIGKEWSQATLIKGLNESDKKQNYPFMLTDGSTLYYAAINEEEGMGNYDIYMTRYDSDTRSFLSPENLGMPFNSPANDYMYVIDEFNNLGWFATDRNQPKDSICIYTFIPTPTRSIYNIDELGSERLGRLAYIHSIRDTWKDQNAVKEARNRLLTLRLGTNQEQKAHDFNLIINDRITYTTLADAQTENGKQKIQWWLESKKDQAATAQQLQQLRDKYAISSTADKQQLAPQIRILENKHEELETSIKTQEKEIRKAELGN